jgi:hypothetical protein
MSKFDVSHFYGGFDSLAVSKEKYSKEQAIEIAKVELESFNKPYFIAIGNGFTRHRAGRNEDGEPCVGWWLEYDDNTKSCPVWCFHKANNKTETFNKDYEYIEVTFSEKGKANYEDCKDCACNKCNDSECKSESCYEGCTRLEKVNVNSICPNEVD